MLISRRKNIKTQKELKKKKKLERNPLVQRVKVPALSLLWPGFDPWPERPHASGTVGGGGRCPKIP